MLKGYSHTDRQLNRCWSGFRSWWSSANIPESDLHSADIRTWAYFTATKCSDIAVAITKVVSTTLPEKVELATARLQEIYEDRCTYESAFQLFIQQENWSTIGEDVDISKVHSQTVQPYITKLRSNLERRFGDTVGKISAAACVFNPMNVDKHMLPEQQEQVKLLSDYFQLSGEDASDEWVCFRNFLQRHHLESSDDICTHLLTTDVGDSFPQLQKLAGILLCCPVGTANVERSFSTMNRVCNKLRQRICDWHQLIWAICSKFRKKVQRN